MIGILAFGSLMNDPGEEIASVIVDCKSVRTPFNVEFARSSKTRDGAPTLVPVRRGGFQVPAIVLVCAKRVSEQEATDMLWRRETRKIGTDRRYKQPKRPTKGNVLVKAICWSGCCSLH